MDKFFCSRNKIEMRYGKILNLFFPPKCGICNEITLSDSFVCYKCKKYLKENELKDRCMTCGGTTYLSGRVCKECSSKRIYYNNLIFCSEYKDKIRERIIEYKFFEKKYLYHFFTELLWEKLRNEKIDIITFVPISKKRLDERGYNQSELIASELSKLLNIKIERTLLRKNRETERQSDLSKTERLKNVNNSFEIADNINIENKSVIVIDDVFTTGATLNACAREIYKMKPSKIVCAVIGVATSSEIY